MSQLTYSKNSIPLWNGADGSVDVNVNDLALAKPIDCGAVASPIVSTSFDIKGGNSSNFGGGNAGSIKLDFDASTSVALAPICHNNAKAAPDLDKEFHISAGLDDQHVAMTLDVGGKADLSLAGSFKYGALGVGAEIDANANGRYVCALPYPANDSLQTILDDFFKNLALPGTLQKAPDNGALYSLEMGGSLKLAVNASAGYSIKGTKDFDVLNLKLSEAYDLSILGKLAVTGEIAGQFSVQVRAGAQPAWANVQVFRKSSKDLQVAADLQIGAQSQLGGLPQTGQEFLGALLGVNAKNWLNLVDDVVSQAGSIQSGADLESKLDGLADTFVSRYANQAIGTIAKDSPELTGLLKRLQNVVNSYQNLDNSAIALFDRYYNVATGKADDLLSALQNISALKSLADFGKNVQGDIPPVLWNVFQQLTNGDPLTAILENPFAAVQKKVSDALSLIQNDAHSDIRDFIALAKSQFGLDPLFNEIAKFDSVANLQAQASDEAQHLIQRLTGTVFSKIPSGDLQKVLNIAKQISNGTADFWKHFDDALSAASSQSFNLELNAAYENSTETTALIDIDINLNDPAGIPFLQAAGVGDFSQILANYNPKVVILNKGSLTHNLQSSSGVKINIVGWHLNFQYQNSFQVLTQADQQIRPTAGGRLNVFTTIDMQAQQNQMRKTTKAEEQVKTNFTLQFLAITNNVIDGSKYDAEHKEYLIDVITGYDAAYDMSFTDTNATPPQLENALAFAKVVGLDAVGATPAGLAPMLNLDNNTYGEIDGEYRVMFTPGAIQNLFSDQAVDEATVRSILKPIVLADFIGLNGISSIGWMYVNDDVKTLYWDQQFNFVQAGTILSDANIVAVSPIPGVEVPQNPEPEEVFDTSTNIANRSVTSVLFQAERGLFKAFSQLQKLVLAGRKNQPINTNDFTNAVNQFGNVLNLIASMTHGQNTTFAVMDGLIRLANPGSPARTAALAVTTHTGGAERHILFQSGAGNIPALIAGSDAQQPA